jgi:hypothetical protein
MMQITAKTGRDTLMPALRKPRSTWSAIIKVSYKKGVKNAILTFWKRQLAKSSV